MALLGHRYGNKVSSNTSWASCKQTQIPIIASILFLILCHSPINHECRRTYAWIQWIQGYLQDSYSSQTKPRASIRKGYLIHILSPKPGKPTGKPFHHPYDKNNYIIGSIIPAARAILPLSIISICIKYNSR